MDRIRRAIAAFRADPAPDHISQLQRWDIGYSEWGACIRHHPCGTYVKLEDVGVFLEGGERALREAVTVIYLTDSSDYLPALWTVVRALNPKIADLLERDSFAAAEAVNPEFGDEID